jgi:hypothetical protein
VSFIFGEGATDFRGTAVAEGPILSPRERMIYNDNRQGKREVLREKPLPVPLSP